jgi:hypothetical protein
MAKSKQKRGLKGFNFLDLVEGAMKYAKPLGTGIAFFVYPGDAAASTAAASLTLAALSALHYALKKK